MNIGALFQSTVLNKNAENKVAELDAALHAGLDATLDWIVEYSSIAGNRAVTSQSFESIVCKLESFGYSDESAIIKHGGPVTAEEMALLIIGNAIDYMNCGEAPPKEHIQDFYQDYKRLKNISADAITLAKKLG